MIRILIDPGSSKTAVLVVEGAAVPLRVLARETIAVGRVIERAEGATIGTRKDGTTYTLPELREVTEQHIRDVADHVRAIALRWGATRAVIETTGRAYLPEGSSSQRAASIAEALKRTGKVESMIGDRLITAGLDVRPVLRATWAARMRPLLATAPAKGSPVTGRGVELVPVLRAHFVEWSDRDDTGRDNEHLRDCGGMALFDVLPTLESRRAARAREGAPKRRERAPVGPIDKAKRNAAQTARNRAKRAEVVAAQAAAGCICPEHPGGRGRRRKAPGCLVHPPTPYGRRGGSVLPPRPKGASAEAWARYLSGEQ